MIGRGLRVAVGGRALRPRSSHIGASILLRRRCSSEATDVNANATGGGAGAVYVESCDPAKVPQQGAYFHITQEGVKTSFPEGLPSSLETAFAHFADGGFLMHRSPARALIEAMKRAGSAAEDAGSSLPLGQRAFYLVGKRGTGKSASLLHAVHWARENDWIVIYVPHARKLLHTGVYCRPSTHYPGMFDMPVNAQALMVPLVERHREQLAAMKVSNEEIRKRHNGTSDMTLLDLVLPGMPVDRSKDEDAFEAAEAVADSCYADLVSELMSTKDVNVMLAIDEYNEWFQPSEWFWGEQLERLQPEKFSILKPLLAFAPSKAGEEGDRADVRAPARGIVAAAETHSFPIVKRITSKIAWKGWAEQMGKSLKPYYLWADPYTEVEFSAAVSHYR
jgi:hypothetical protein